jgi:hypothetical protein
VLVNRSHLDAFHASPRITLSPPNPAVQQPQVAQQLPVNYWQNAYIPGTSVLSPYSYYQPPAPFPYHQQTVPVQPPAPATPQPNTYQPLPYTPGLKEEDIMTIATTIALAFAKQLTPLFQQQPRGNAGQNNGQNQGAFTCPFCGEAGHEICNCTVAQTYVTKNHFNRMLDTQITVTTHEILATAPEVRKSFKDATTTCKVPTLANPAKVYIDTNTQLANQVQLCCHKVHHNLLVAKELHSLCAIMPKIEGLHEVECILDSRSQIVSISEAIWRTLN